MEVKPEDRFYIEDGVHRALACRILGLHPIPALLARDGMPRELIFVEADQLHSPKGEIDRWDRGRDFMMLVELLRDLANRQRFQAIEVQWLGAPGQTGSIPLKDVVINGI